MEKTEPNLREAVERVMRMMAIPGCSGEEGQIMRFITDELRIAGLPHSAMRFDPVHQRCGIGEVGALVVKLPGTAGRTREPRRMLMAHVDTVPLCSGCKPVIRGRRGNRGQWIRSANPATALGADNRSGATAILTAALTILRNKLPHPPLIFLWTVQEEVGLRGVRHLSLAPLGRPALAFNFDGSTPLRLTIGATGGYRVKIDVEGLASHAGMHPELGVSAITVAALAIADLQRRGWLGLVKKGGGRGNNRTGTANVGVIQGGKATNVVTSHVGLAAEVRSHDRQFRKTMLRHVIHAFKKAAGQVKNVAGVSGKVLFDAHLDYESFRLKPTEPCVRAAQQTIRQVTGRAAELTIINGGLDANWMSARGIPTVSLGAGGHGAHTVDETLNIREFQQACRIATRLGVGNF